MPLPDDPLPDDPLPDVPLPDDVVVVVVVVRDPLPDEPSPELPPPDPLSEIPPPDEPPSPGPDETGPPPDEPESPPLAAFTDSRNRSTAGVRRPSGASTTSRPSTTATSCIRHSHGPRIARCTVANTAASGTHFRQGSATAATSHMAMTGSIH